jgi:hypothetical protein
MIYCKCNAKLSVGTIQSTNTAIDCIIRIAIAAFNERGILAYGFQYEFLLKIRS